MGEKRSVEKINEKLRKYGWEVCGEYNGCDKPVTVRCLKCGQITTKKTLPHARGTKCRKCHEHICLNCGKSFSLQVNCGGLERKFCYECLPTTNTQEGRDQWRRLWLKHIYKEIDKKYGLKCAMCGYDENIAALDFHHKDSNEKEYAPARLIHSYLGYKNLGILFNELDKCQILCTNCHRKLHSPHLNKNEYFNNE